MRSPCLVAHDIQSTPKNILSIELSDVEATNSSDIAYWIVDMQNWQAGWKLVVALRLDLSPKVYLRPIIYLNPEDTTPEEIIKASDGVLVGDLLDNQTVREHASRLEVINQWIERLPDPDTAADTNIAFKALRMTASRGVEQKPITTVHRISGYAYPLIDPFLPQHDSGMLETLEFLREQKLLTSHFINKANFCSNCGSAFINFKEVCPQCNTDDLSVDELLHHFRCAHVAVMSDYQRGSSMVCPKCDRELHHIGVDYDKPSIMYKCNKCSHGFQEPKIMTTCYNCKRSTEPENQINREIFSYAASAIGQNAAIHGMEALFSRILDSELQLSRLDAFKGFYRVEASRIQRYKKSESSLAMLALRDIETLYIRLGARSAGVFGELSAVFRTVLRKSDVITARNESIFFVIMTETDLKCAQRAVERLREGITELLSKSLDYEPDISTLVKPVSVDMDLDKMLEEFLSG
jgi:uncharacterized OB-fold protein